MSDFNQKYTRDYLLVDKLCFVLDLKKNNNLDKTFYVFLSDDITSYFIYKYNRIEAPFIVPQCRNSGVTAAKPVSHNYLKKMN